MRIEDLANAIINVDHPLCSVCNARSIRATGMTIELEGQYEFACNDCVSKAAAVVKKKLQDK